MPKRMEHTRVHTSMRGMLHTRNIRTRVQKHEHLYTHTYTHTQVIGSLFFMASYREVCTVFEVKAIR